MDTFYFKAVELLFAAGICWYASSQLSKGLLVFANHLTGAESADNKAKNKKAVEKISSAFYFFTFSILVLLWLC